jgi:chromosomal replication initiation ATPase DnaA
MYKINQKINYSFFEEVRSLFGVSLGDLKKRSRTEPLASIRALVGCYMHHELEYSRNRIAEIFDRDKTNISHYFVNHKDRMDADKAYRKSYNALLERLTKDKQCALITK